MGYYFIHNNSYLDNFVAKKLQIIWIGEDAFNNYLKVRAELLNDFENGIDHQVITFNRIKNPDSISFNVLFLNEVYPLWKDDYNLVQLEEAFDYLLKESFIKVNNVSLFIGNAGELFFQGFLNSLMKVDKKLVSKSSFILLEEAFTRLAFKAQISNTEDFLERNSDYVLSISPESFDWNSLFESFKLVINSKANKLHLHNFSNTK
jgi:hypothetical protein